MRGCWTLPSTRSGSKSRRHTLCEEARPQKLLHRASDKRRWLLSQMNQHPNRYRLQRIQKPRRLADLPTAGQRLLNSQGLADPHWSSRGCRTRRLIPAVEPCRIRQLRMAQSGQANWQRRPGRILKLVRKLASCRRRRRTRLADESSRRCHCRFPMEPAVLQLPPPIRRWIRQVRGRCSRGFS